MPGLDNPQNTIEPRFHFRREKVLIGEGDGSPVFVSELVRKGQLLVDYPDFKTLAAKGFTKEPVNIGANTSISEDTVEIFAAVTGYPRIDTTFSLSADAASKTISIEPLIKISADKMKATVNIHPPLPSGFSPHQTDLKDILLETGIIHGLDSAQFDTVQKYLAERHNEFASFLIAKGTEVIHGTDARLDFLMDVGPIPGKLLSNGSIDFRERRTLIPINEHQIIARKLPASPGIAGKTITGEKIEPRAGKDVLIQTSHDARFFSDKNEVVAIKSGSLSIVGNSIIRVCSNQEIRGDIDYETGNIESNNCISIDGSVQPGFKVACVGDLQIKGGIQSAKITSQGNIILKAGVTGEESLVEAAGDIDIPFVELGVIKAGGTIILRKQAYLSHIVAKGSIHCTAESKIIGGMLVAEGSISAGYIGTDNSPPALLAACVDWERLAHHQDLKQQLLRQQKEIIDWLENYPGTNRSKKVRQMEAEAAETKQLLLRLNLIPGTGIYSRAGSEQETDEKSESDIDLRSIHIEISGTVTSGTILRIGNKKMIFETTLSSRLFKLDDELKRIVAAPLKRKRAPG